MNTFKQYMIGEMGGDLNAGYISSRTKQFNPRAAERDLKPLMIDANTLLRNRDRILPDQLKIQVQDLLTKFVDKYEDLGDEPTELKAKIADKYTQVKQLLNRRHTLEDCVQILEQVVDLFNG